jgi:hypothetical protein
MKTIKNAMGDQKGISIVFVAICLLMFLTIVALALDIGHLVVTRNELQNAADAGALAGARQLYDDEGRLKAVATITSIAIAAAEANYSDNVAVDSVEAYVGHWSFKNHEFTSIGTDYYEVPILWGVTEEQLDVDTKFINAVKVIPYRKTTKVQSWFSTILGKTGFIQGASAVAYIGFAGRIDPLGVDLPIAICEEALGTPYNCTVGRLINSGGDLSTSESGWWTDFNQGIYPDEKDRINDPCSGGANRQTVGDAVTRGCTSSGANQNFVVFNKEMALINGQVQTEFTSLRNCWMDKTGGNKLWEVVLPVIDCDGEACDSRTAVAKKVVGAVSVNIAWISEGGTGQLTAPQTMHDPSGATMLWDGRAIADESARWESFVRRFNLKNLNGSDAPLAKKTVYFLPSCEAHPPTGVTGGKNFGVLAKIPVLVE